MRRQGIVEQRLTTVPMFAACTRAEIAALSRLATEIEVAAGQQLTRQGEPGREFFIIIDGEAEVTRDGRTVARLADGDYFGEIALLDDVPRTATVTSLTPMTLAVIGFREFWGAIDEIPALAHNILRGLARRLTAVEMHEPR